METRNKVRLPDGQIAVEVETIHKGGSETQATYKYFKLWNSHNDRLCLGEKIDVSGFEKDYWGKVKGIS